MKFLLEYRLVRNGGVLFEFVKHLQRYIKTSVNLEKMEKMYLYQFLQNLILVENLIKQYIKILVVLME